MKVILSDKWHEAYPHGGVGILVMAGLINPKGDTNIESLKRELETTFRERFTAGGKAAIRALPVMQAYGAYYKKFDKSYHVQLQTESVALQGRSLPSVSSLVDTMFMVELKNGLLTAGHDLNTVVEPLTIGVAMDDETYTMMNGKVQTLKADDMFMSDAEGVISSVLYGPDSRTQITLNTTAAMFVVYAPEGIDRETTMNHLTEIQDGIKQFSPDSKTELLDTFAF
jgi:DNA/RNA-binding domain of Phe-tRNA-synthetase-like protein